MSVHAYTRIITLATILACGFAMQSSAEDEFGNSETANQHSLSFRGEPFNQCKSFLITEVGFRAYLDKYKFDDYYGGAVTIELGWMKNFPQNYALGLSAYQAIDGRAYRFGIRPHILYWLDRRISADLSAGPLLYCNEGEFMSWGSEKPRYDADGPGIIASFSLSAFELIAATVQYERFNVIDSRGIPSAGVLPGTSYMQNKFSVGMMMQSYVGGAVMAIVLVAAALD